MQAKNRIENFGSSYGNADASAYFGDYSVLSDGSTDSSVTEQETIYILFICGGVSALKYFSIESVKVADSAGVKEMLEKAFLRFGFKNYYGKLVGLHLDWDLL